MSSIWTPDGEQPVNTNPSGGQAGPAAAPTEEEMAAYAEELRTQLLATPANVVVANHGYGLFELAALHLGNNPPSLDQAQVAIDALAAILERVGDQLDEHGKTLNEGLAQLQMAYVQIRNAVTGEGEAPANPEN